PHALAEKVAAGALGRKAGRGFYPWTSTDVEEFDDREARHLAGHMWRDRRTAGTSTPTAVVRGRTRCAGRVPRPRPDRVHGGHPTAPTSLLRRTARRDLRRTDP